MIGRDMPSETKKKASYRRRTDPGNRGVVSHRNERCQSSVKAGRKGCSEFWEERGMDQPSVSYSMPMGGIAEQVKRWVSRGKR